MAHWLDSAIFYEIYPQSFKDSNADGMGDLPGIIEKLDYVKELGCNAIWLNPCFESPFGDAGYDISDFYSVAPRYGTNEDLKHLFEEAHEAAPEKHRRRQADRFRDRQRSRIRLHIGAREAEPEGKGILCQALLLDGQSRLRKEP